MFFSPAPDHHAVADQYRIVRIERHSTFSGRTGREVRETWTVVKDGREVKVLLSPYHTRVARTVQYDEGDTVTIRSKESHGVVRACQSDVSRK